METISHISPVTDAEAARMVSTATMTDLAQQITAMAPDMAPPAVMAPRTGTASWRSRRRWVMVTAPLAAGAAAAALVMTAFQGAPQQHPQVSIGKTTIAQPLAFIASTNSTTVIVRDPLASPGSYRAEFARHHLSITLKLVPASPSLVGTLVYMGEDPGTSTLAAITAKGKCYTGGGGSACPVGVRIPAGFHGHADLVFGRAAKPGEQYASTASAFAPGEAMYGMHVTGETVSQVLVALRGRHLTAAVFHYNRNNYGVLLRPSQVPGTWYVYDADPWAPGQVMLFVGPTVKQPGVASPPRPAKS